MAILWQTPAGSLGTYPSASKLSLQFWANSENPSSMMSYKFLSGELPPGTVGDPVTISSSGLMTGTLANVLQQKTYNFTVRAFDHYGTVRDRTFSMNLVNLLTPKFITLPGTLLTAYDSEYVTYQMLFSNSDASNTVKISVSTGTLPPGLQINDSGLITGYPLPPTLSDNSPINKTYTFSLQLSSALGNSSETFSIVVKNQRLTRPVNTRVPVILNSRPRVFPIDVNDIYYDYYVGADNVIDDARANEQFAYKIIGYDFDASVLEYIFTNMPTGLTGDINTGWVTGSISMPTDGISKYQFSVSVRKKERPTVVSSVQTFTFVISNNLVSDIQWQTDAAVGTIRNGTVSEMQITATSSKLLSYSITNGSLPPNLELLETGEIVGRVAFQPTSELLAQGAASEFTFTAMAYVAEYPLLRSYKTFTITVDQYYAAPYENIYIKASPSVEDRLILQTLFDDAIIPTSYLYRPNDPNFGKAEDVRYIHTYGMNPSSISDYLSAISTNHYWRRVVLGGLKTAVARDENGYILYEVVYSEIVDDLVTSTGKTLPPELNWSKRIYLNDTDWINGLYPASTPNMRSTVINAIGQNTDINILPKWMSSQQADGGTTGFVQGWVICYTLPGKSDLIKSNIENNWDHKLNEIEFIVDRYLIDRSATYDWNLNLIVPAWNELPSSTPAPTSLDDYNLSILFPRKTILPTDTAQ